MNFLGAQEELSIRVRFVADGMLGKLSRWLRLLGYDVLYFRDKSDAALLDLAEVDSRILLTKDFGLYHTALKRGVKVVYLRGSSLDEDLAYLAVNVGVNLSVDFSLSRCPICNSRLVQVSSDSVVGLVPSKILSSFKVFWLCIGCGKIYWAGTHWRSIRNRLNRVRQLASTRD